MIVYAHPYDKSYNRAIRDATVKGLGKAAHEIDLVDLYKDKFNPVLSVEDLEAALRKQSFDPVVIDYQRRIEKVQHIIFIAPIWFESVPAIMKGFLDRVFTHGWAYEKVEGKGVPKGNLTHLSATVISTLGSPKFVYRLFYNNALKGVLINGTLKCCGVKKVKWFMLDKIQETTEERRKQFLSKIEDYMSNLA
jgi:putative NADPH-quinone reductase